MKKVPMGLLALFFAVCLNVHPAAAQSSGRTGGSVEVGLRASTLRDGTEALWGGAALLHLHPRLSLGGAGWVLMDRSIIEVPTPGTDLEMTFGYGGVMAAFHLLDGTVMDLSVRLLAGVGNARALLPVVGSEVGRADNFGVLEPELSASVAVLPWMSVRASAAYLYSYGVEGLPETLKEDLAAYSAGVSLVIGIH